jgi:hypothetical protein
VEVFDPASTQGEESLPNELSFITSREPNIGPHLEELVVIFRCHGNVCFGLLYPLQRKRVLASRCLENGLPLVRCYSSFQAVFTEPLPSNGHIRHNIIRTIK